MSVINKGNINIKVPASCLHFGKGDGSGYVKVPKSDSTTPSGLAMSFACWVKLLNTEPSAYVLVKRSRLVYGWYIYTLIIEPVEYGISSL